jgi:hypothetical protein
MSQTGGIAQVVESLPSKFEALNSNPGITKKKEKRKKEISLFKKMLYL